MTKKTTEHPLVYIVPDISSPNIGPALRKKNL